MLSAQDGAGERHRVNKRAASTIIMLCAVAVAAVVLVHKESAVNVVEEGTVSQPLMEQDFSDEMVLVQKSKPKAHKHRRHSADEVIRLEQDAKTPESEVVPTKEE